MVDLIAVVHLCGFGHFLCMDFVNDLFSFRQGYQAEPLAKWVEDRAGVHVCSVHGICDLPVLPYQFRGSTKIDPIERVYCLTSLSRSHRKWRYVVTTPTSIASKCE